MRKPSLILLVLLSLAACGGASHPRRHRQTPAAPQNGSVITVQASRPGRTIPPGFVGISFEYWNLPTYVGTAPNALDPVFAQLVRNLAPGQQPVVRIGGVSTDHTWYPTPGSPTPPWVQYKLTPNWLRLAHALAGELNARMILGINFEANSPLLAASESQALVNAVGPSHVAGLELGNEPELYAGFPWYRVGANLAVRGRSKADWTPSLFAGQFGAISKALPHVPLAGPTTGSQPWIAQLAPFLQANPAVKLVTIHAYPLKRCRATTHVTAAQLLAKASSNGLAALNEPAVRTAHQAGDPIRIAEMNSVSCGGEAGLSDTFAASLWSVDALFAMANAGVDGVNFHSTPFVTNHLFTVQKTGGRWRGHVYPVYYGLELFAKAAPPGSRLLPISAHLNPATRAWATRATDGTTRVVLINTSARRAAVTVRLAGASARPGALERLTAPNGIASTTGLALAGQSFGAQTTSGTPAGALVQTPLSATTGAYHVVLAPESAALLTVP
ncbi:MAG: glycosyl hydrolase family 79 C-terminal domain-containing protein [Solirubrobacteraceae bacterium]